MNESVTPEDTIFSQNTDRSHVHRTGQEPISSPDLGDTATPSTSGTGGPNRTTQTPDITQMQSEDLGQAPCSNPIQTDDAIVCPLCQHPFAATDIRQRRQRLLGAPIGSHEFKIRSASDGGHLQLLTDEAISFVRAVSQARYHLLRWSASTLLLHLGRLIPPNVLLGYATQFQNALDLVVKAL